MSELRDWGPWIKHDGKGCPCIGFLVEVEIGGGRRRQILAGKENAPAWRWTMLRYLGVPVCWERGWEPVIRYRMKAVRGATLLHDLVNGVPSCEPTASRGGSGE